MQQDSGLGSASESQTTIHWGSVLSVSILPAANKVKLLQFTLLPVALDGPFCCWSAATYPNPQHIYGKYFWLFAADPVPCIGWSYFIPFFIFIVLPCLKMGSPTLTGSDIYYWQIYFSRKSPPTPKKKKAWLSLIQDWEEPAPATSHKKHTIALGQADNFTVFWLPRLIGLWRGLNTSSSHTHPSVTEEDSMKSWRYFELQLPLNSQPRGKKLWELFKRLTLY